jgi:hypothetical protein
MTKTRAKLPISSAGTGFAHSFMSAVRVDKRGSKTDAERSPKPLDEWKTRQNLGKGGVKQGMEPIVLWSESAVGPQRLAARRRARCPHPNGSANRSMQPCGVGRIHPHRGKLRGAMGLYVVNR